MGKTLDEAISEARAILDDAIEEHKPVAIFSGFSGGHDSLVVTHFTMNHRLDARPLHINTGIGIEKTRQYVRDTCRRYGWDLLERTTSESYEEFVLANGFPGPPMHNRMYQRLKERVVRQVVREAKEGRHYHDRVMFVTGIRSDESRRRTGYKRAVSKVDAQVWVNPFYWATSCHFREYRERFSLPENPVVLRLGMSGECLCGAYADRGELGRIRAACPETADYIEDLQRRANEAGFPWGYEESPPEWFLKMRRDAASGQMTIQFDDVNLAEIPRPLCHGCEKTKGFV